MTDSICDIANKMYLMGDLNINWLLQDCPLKGKILLDVLNHVLFDKLKYYKFASHTICWFNSCLPNRKQCVFYHGSGVTVWLEQDPKSESKTGSM